MVTQDLQGDLTDLRKEIEKYIGKLGSTIVNSKIQLSVSSYINVNLREQFIYKGKSKGTVHI